LFVHVFAAGDAANRSNLKLGARFSNPFRVASFASTVFRAAVPRMAIPARPFAWTVLLRMMFPVASWDGVLIRIPQ
jgi:hypothetical protein